MNDLEKSLQKMINTTKTFDNFQAMCKTTRSFDAEMATAKAASAKAISNAFRRMLHLTHRLEDDNKTLMRVNALNRPPGDGLFDTLASKLPAKYRRLPYALKKRPNVVIKYFLGMILGRILAIILYIIAAFIPAIPVPESVSGLVGKPLKAVGSMVGGARDLSPAMVMTVVSNIPTDINKLLQKLGEFFQFYGRRVSNFAVKAVRNPKLAYEDVNSWARANARLFVRLSRSAIALCCSFIMIKLAMILLLPLFGGIAITVVGLKVSLLLFVACRMVFDKVGEVVGCFIHRKIVGIWHFYKAVRDALRYWS